MALIASKPKESAVQSTWIRANAGSGKTTALVARVVTLLLLGVTPERICCITYTKAAAGEMRERILHALRDLLILPDEPCRAKITALIGSCTNDQLNHARSLFARVLDSAFGGLELTTIHGFCQQLLRRFPLEANLSPQFTVLEEAESENMQRLARQRVLQRAEGELAEALAIIAERGGEHGFTELTRAAAHEAYHWQQSMERYPLPELLRAAIFDLHDLPPDANGDTLCRDCCANLINEEMKPRLRAALAGLTSVNEQKLVPALTRWLEGCDSDTQLELLDELSSYLVTQKGTANSKAFTQKVPEREFFERLRDRCVELNRQCNAVACAEESYAAALVCRAFTEQYNQLKAEYQSLDYDDLIVITEQLLREHSGWVMSKLDHRIDHLLVDEAQDTSPGQWRIVRALVEELMVTGGGIGSGGVPRSLLVVGDEKQSIFSFQGADPRQFFAEENRFAELLEASGQPLANEVLAKSYRSAKAVLDLVDKVAAMPEVAPALSAAGLPQPHELVHHKLAGKVVLYPPVEKNEKAEIKPFTIPETYQITQSTAQRLADKIAEDVKLAIANGRAPGDVLILLWRRQPMADCLIRALERRDIPVAGIDRLKLSEHLAVQDVMALMAWCGYPNDDLALAQILRSPIIGIGGDELENLAYGRIGTLWQAVQKTRYAEQLQSLLNGRHQSPYDFLTQVLEVQNTRIRFAERFGEEVHEVLDELKSQAAAMPKRMLPTLASFHDWITRSERDVKRQQEARSRAVRIMTVHGAKGLEAPLVILADTARVPDTARERSLEKNNLPLIAFSEQASQATLYEEAKAERKQELFEEYYRLLYVALTRAKDELHIYAADPVRDGSWYVLAKKALEALPHTKEADNLVLANPGASAPKEEGAPSAELPLPAWTKTSSLLPSKRVAVLSPSRLAPQEANYNMAGGAGANVRGERIHRVLQFLGKAADRTRIDQLLVLVAPDWDAATRAKTAQEIETLYLQERWIWEKPSFPEVNIGGTVEGQRFSGQIDRLIVTDDEVMILDYKTGVHVPKSAMEASEAYRLQLKLYRELVRQLHPGKTVRTALVWTHIPSLMWMDKALDGTAWPQNLTKN